MYKNGIDFKRQLTFGPHRSCRVTQQISVLQYVHLTQSQPHFFSRITWQLGHCRASPVDIRPLEQKNWLNTRFEDFIFNVLKKSPQSIPLFSWSSHPELHWALIVDTACSLNPREWPENCVKWICFKVRLWLYKWATFDLTSDAV